MGFLPKIFLTRYFFLAFLPVILGYIAAFYFPSMLPFVGYALYAVIILVILDLVLLSLSKTGISGQREVNDKLSNGDINRVKIKLKNHFPFRVRYTVLDEIPPEFQIFDFQITGFLSAGGGEDLDYDLTPKERGSYNFGKTMVFVESPLRLFQRKFTLSTEKTIRVFPSFLRLNRYSLGNFRLHLNEAGIKKIRRVGHSMEFEQIKEYVAGDDVRTLNWKATAKQREFMVNQYMEERSQQIYCAIDTGRMMKMPFNGLSLLDYAINSSLILSNIVLQSQDRAGVFTFSNRLENFVKAERRSSQIRKISEALYRIKTNYAESDFGKLYNTLKFKIRQRGLILLFTNFDSPDSLHRQLPYLQAINKNHLLVVVFFRDTELEGFLSDDSREADAYQRTLVEKFVYEKQRIALELQKFGIQTLLTEPENLTIHTINKYLEIKSRGML